MRGKYQLTITKMFSSVLIAWLCLAAGNSGHGQDQLLATYNETSPILDTGAATDLTVNDGPAGTSIGSAAANVTFTIKEGATVTTSNSAKTGGKPLSVTGFNPAYTVTLLNRGTLHVTSSATTQGEGGLQLQGSGAVLDNYGTIEFGNLSSGDPAGRASITMINGATLNNHGVIDVDTDAFFSVSDSVLNNSGGVINLNATLGRDFVDPADATGFFDALMAGGAGVTSIGTINLNQGFLSTQAQSAFTYLSGNTLSGTVNFNELVGAVPPGAYDVDIGAATAVFKGGGSGDVNYIGDITAAGLETVAGGSAVDIYGEVSGLTQVTAGATVAFRAGGGAVSGASIVNNSEIVNERTLILDTTNTYSGTGAVDNSAGTLSIEYNAGNKGIFEAVAAGAGGAIGTVQVQNQVAGGEAFAGLAGASSGTVEFHGQVGSSAANTAVVDVGGATADFLAANNHVGRIVAGQIDVHADTTFHGAITAGGLDALAGETVFADGSSYSGDLTVSAPVIIDGGEVAIGVGGPEILTQSNTLTVKAGSLTLGPDADLGSNTGETIVGGSGPNRFGTLHFDLKANPQDYINNLVKLERYGVLDLVSTDPNGFVFDGSNAANYQPASAAAGSAIQFSAGDGDAAITIDGFVYQTGNADAIVNTGTVKLANPNSGIASSSNMSSLTIRQDATLLVEANPNAALDFAASNVAGTVDISDDPTNRLTFGGTAAFAENSKINLASSADGIGILDASAFTFGGRTKVNIVAADEDDPLGKTILAINGALATQMDAGYDVIGGQYLYNPIYEISTWGEILRIKGRVETFEELIGDDLSLNQTALADHIDSSPSATRSLTGRYLTALSDAAGNDTELARAGIDQLGGEAQATAALMGVRSLNNAFQGKLDSVFAETMGLALMGGDRCAPLDAYGNLASGRAQRSRNGGYDFVDGSLGVWAGYVGNWSEQKRKDRILGYETVANGATVGLQYRRGRWAWGLAGGYMRADTDVDSVYAKFTSDVYTGGVYLDYLHESGFFGRASVAYGSGSNEYDMDMVVGGTKHGSFDNNYWSMYAEMGYTVRFAERFNLIASAGANFVRYDTDDWTETIAGDPYYLAANWYRAGTDYAVDIPLRLRMNGVVYDDGFTMLLEGRVGWIHNARSLDQRLTMGFAGDRGGVAVRGVADASGRLTAGFGVTALFGNCFDLNLNYDYEHASRFNSHNVSAFVGYAF